VSLYFAPGGFVKVIDSKGIVEISCIFMLGVSAPMDGSASDMGHMSTSPIFCNCPEPRVDHEADFISKRMLPDREFSNRSPASITD
jgi:hypothetical protein